jgi:hypothetical protein
LAGTAAGAANNATAPGRKVIIGEEFDSYTNKINTNKTMKNKLVTKINCWCMAGLGLACVLLSGVTAKAQDGNATTNTPPNINAKSPTYEQTLEWLKKAFTNNACFYHDNHRDDDHLTTDILTSTDGKITILCHNDGKGSKSETSNWRLIFDLSAISKATGPTQIPGWVPPVYNVVLHTAGSKKVIMEDDGPPDNIVTLYDSISVFNTNDFELANRVSKAFNNLIELAPKDDLFK